MSARTESRPDTAAPDKYERSLGLEAIADALYYLESLQPLVGCDFTGDDRFAMGRDAIMRLIEGELRRLAQ